jgi:predicted TIM-barrel fold metal-dependent hydrolase
MKFFDANILYGIPSQKRIYEPVPDVQTLLHKLREFGISKAIVHREEQLFSGPVSTNALLADEIRQTDNLWGIWTVLPPHCNEMPSPDKILAEMKENRIVGWQFLPTVNRYPFHWRVLKTWLELAEKHHIPLFIDFEFVNERELLDIMDKYPELTVILKNASVWPPDRILRSFMSEFPNAYMETSYYLLADGIEKLLADGYGKRILFSTRFQTMHVGGPMLMLKHADISEAEKALIASGNLERILQGIDYDKQ